MHRMTRLELDRGWITFTYAYMFAYALFMTFMPFLIINKTDLMWTFMYLGPVLAGLTFYLMLCAKTDKIHNERLFLPFYASFLIILGTFRVSHIMLAQGDYVESITNIFLYMAVAGVLLYRANTLDKIINDQKEIQKMERESE